MFNQRSWLDANIFAIPSEMKLKLTDAEWESFLVLCGEAFGAITPISLSHFQAFFVATRDYYPP